MGSILLVEHSANIRDLLAREFRREGHAVGEASDAAEALGLIERGREVDVVVLDGDMPGIADGSDPDILFRLAAATEVVLHVYSGVVHPEGPCAKVAAVVAKDADFERLKLAVGGILSSRSGRARGP